MGNDDNNNDKRTLSTMLTKEIVTMDGFFLLVQFPHNQNVFLQFEKSIIIEFPTYSSSKAHLLEHPAVTHPSLKRLKLMIHLQPDWC